MSNQEFWRIYRAVYRRRWLALAIFGTTLGAVLLACLFTPRYYRASAYVMPSQKALTQPIIPGAGVMPGGSGGDLRSAEASFITMVGLARMGGVLQRASSQAGLRLTSAKLADLVTVEPAQGTLIRVTALSRTSDGAVKLANAVSYEFAKYYRDLASRQAIRGRKFLEGELQTAATERDAAQSALQAYKASEREAALPTGERENPFLSQFYMLRAEQETTRSQLREVEARIEATREALAKELPTKEIETATTDNPETRRLQDELARLEGELLLAQTRYTDKHRKVKDLKLQIADIRERLSEEADRMVTHRSVGANPTHERLAVDLVDLGTQRAALTGRLSALRAAMDENEQRAGELADTSVVLLAKTREYDNAQAKYERLAELLSQAKVAEQASRETGEIQVVDRASSAVGPVVRKGPAVTQLAGLGFALAVVLALGVALALEFVDDRVRRREDLGRAMELPVPAVIPQLTDSGEGVALARITEQQPLSAHAEAYRFLRTELMHHDGLARLRTVLVATARPGQGGSTTAVNLAIALAEAGRHVVLVDADLRRPVLHRYFGLANEAGLTTLLSNGEGAVTQSLQRTSMENLLLLPAGPPAANPAALLSSEQMRVLIARLRENSDYVVFDAPSAVTFTDAAVLAAQVDGVIMVVRANQRLRDSERRTKELFVKVGANVVGAVLNDAPPAEVDSYFFHHQYYSRSSALPPGGGADGPGAATGVVAEGSTVPPAAGQGPRPALTGGGQAASVAIAPPARQPGRAAAIVSERPLKRPVQRRGAVIWGAAAVVLAAGIFWFALSSWSPSQPERTRPAPGAAAAVAMEPGVKVVAVVKSPTDVRVERDGETLYEGTLTAGQQIWEGSREVTVWASRPAAIEVTVNGKAIGPLGKEGEPAVSKRFTPESGGQE